jgi:hypothetical protein
MAVQRVYVPSTLDRLAGLREAHQIGPAPFTGYAVTPQVVAATPDDDQEEREHLVTLSAARASLQLLLGDLAGGWRRVVLAVDVDARFLAPSTADDDPAAIEVLQPPAIVHLAAVFVDGDDAEQVIAVAEQTRDLEAADDVNLLWFAPSEIATILDTMR